MTTKNAQRTLNNLKDFAYVFPKSHPVRKMYRQAVQTLNGCKEDMTNFPDNIIIGLVNKIKKHNSKLLDNQKDGK